MSLKKFYRFLRCAAILDHFARGSLLSVMWNDTILNMAGTMKISSVGDVLPLSSKTIGVKWHHNNNNNLILYNYLHYYHFRHHRNYDHHHHRNTVQDIHVSYDCMAPRGGAMVKRLRSWAANGRAPRWGGGCATRLECDWSSGVRIFRLL